MFCLIKILTRTTNPMCNEDKWIIFFSFFLYFLILFNFERRHKITNENFLYLLKMILWITAVCTYKNLLIKMCVCVCKWQWFFKHLISLNLFFLFISECQQIWCTNYSNSRCVGFIIQKMYVFFDLCTK